MKFKFEVDQSDTETIHFLRNEFQVIEDYPTNGLDGGSVLALIIAIIGIIPVEKIMEIAMRPTVTVHVQYPDGKYIEISGTSIKKVEKQLAAVEEMFSKTDD